jgi:hypothetical protein
VHEVATLESQPGIRVRRLSVHRDEWDEIPHRLAADGRHVVRVDWFTTIPRHTVSVTAAGKQPIALLVVPPVRPEAPPDRHERGSHRPGRCPGR